jgi:hypothetical protein
MQPTMAATAIKVDARRLKVRLEMVLMQTPIDDAQRADEGLPTVHAGE